MGQTNKYGLRYPENTDLAKNTAMYIKNLAEDIETKLPLSESINITTGTEYETGRVIDNKTEYATRIDCGALLSSDTKTIQTSIPNTYTITDYYGIGYWDMINTTPILLPHLGGSIPTIGTMSEIYLNVSYSTGNYRIHITTTNELANLITSSFVTICYTKP